MKSATASLSRAAPGGKPLVRRRALADSSNAKAERGKGAMLISALARATGHTVHTIRWYESQRLIPAVRRDLQGRRTYIPWHIAWLELVDRLRRTGMSIRQIRDYAGMVKRGDGALPECLALMQAHRARIQALQLDLQQSMQLINLKIDYYSDWLATGVQPPPHPEFRHKERTAKEGR